MRKLCSNCGCEKGWHAWTNQYGNKGCAECSCEKYVYIDYISKEMLCKECKHPLTHHTEDRNEEVVYGDDKDPDRFTIIYDGCHHNGHQEEIEGVNRFISKCNCKVSSKEWNDKYPEKYIYDLAEKLERISSSNSR